MTPETMNNIRTLLDYISETNYQRAADTHMKTHKSMKSFRCPLSSDQQFLVTLLDKAFVLSDDIAVELGRSWVSRGFHDDAMDMIRYITKETFPTKEMLYQTYRVAL